MQGRLVGERKEKSKVDEDGVDTQRRKKKEQEKEKCFGFTPDE